MITLDRVIGAVIVIGATIHTASYGRWTWKTKNRFGALMLFLLSAAVLCLPLYSLFIK